MNLRPYLCAMSLLAGCGLADDAQVKCRCTADSDLILFPTCRDAVLSTERPDAAIPQLAALPAAIERLES